MALPNANGQMLSTCMRAFGIMLLSEVLDQHLTGLATSVANKHTVPLWREARAAGLDTSSFEYGVAMDNETFYTTFLPFTLVYAVFLVPLMHCWHVWLEQRFPGQDRLRTKWIVDCIVGSLLWILPSTLLMHILAGDELSEVPWAILAAWIKSAVGSSYAPHSYLAMNTVSAHQRVAFIAGVGLLGRIFFYCICIAGKSLPQDRRAAFGNELAQDTVRILRGGMATLWEGGLRDEL